MREERGSDTKGSALPRSPASRCKRGTVKNEKEPSYPQSYEGNAIVAIFRDRRMVADFVTGFVDMHKLEVRFEFERATLLDRAFMSNDLRKGERDIAWKVPFTKGQVYFIFLIEHQSAVDFEMPQRLLHYIDVIWQHIRNATPEAERRAKEFRLPPVVPVVFYTGERPWTGHHRLSDVVAFGEQLRPHLPDFELQIVQVRALEDEELAKKDTWGATIIRLIGAFVTKPRREKFDEIARAFDKYKEIPGLAPMVEILYHHSHAEGRPEVARRLKVILESEDQAMSQPEVIGKRFWDAWNEEALVKGRTEGAAEGEARGLAEGLHEQLEAIREFFTRRGLDWAAYEGDVRSLQSTPEAARFLVDLATASDTARFLRERFAH